MTFDVAVVGGGPAAASAAISLRTAGHSVCVVGASRHRRKPTETSKAQLRHLLNVVGAASALNSCEPCHGILSDWASNRPIFRSTIIDPFGSAWFINRVGFDAELKRLANEAGANWVEATGRNATINEEGVQVHTNEGEFRAKWLVIANGSLHWASCVTSQPIRVSDTLIASWAHLSCVKEEKLLHTEASDEGWWYLCPDLNGGTVACFITDPEGNRTLKPFIRDRWFDLFSRTRFSAVLRNLQAPNDVNVLRTGLAILDRRHGQRWVSVGDSAMILDPIGSSGTFAAIDSAHRAAVAVDRALTGDAALLEQYEHWTRDLFEEFTRQRTALYKQEKYHNPGHFWQRRVGAKEAFPIRPDRSAQHP